MAYDDNVHSKVCHNNTTCHLVAHSGLEVIASFRDESERNLSFLSVVATDGLHVYPDSEKIWHETGFLSLVAPAQPRQSVAVHSIHRELYDINFAKGCLSRCRHDHDHPYNSLSMGTTPFIRLIDCQSRKVITAPLDSDYIALSYVWGKPIRTSGMDDSESYHLPDLDNCPKVVTDSLQVALDLNFKYLWVDKYCIDQLNDEDMATQLGQMDLIYASAQITIIAAAGKGPHHGLPGVAGTFLYQQAALQVGDHHIASTLPHGRNIVLKSKWATRGWTYQEAIFSRRRLIFTDEQLFWECNGMYCAEAIELRCALVDNLRDGLFKRTAPETHFWAFDPWTFLDYISEFRKKNLTYQSDSLNALSGAFRAFERRAKPIYQIMGVPIFFPAGLSWNVRSPPFSKSATQGFLIGLTWLQGLLPRERVHIFPSWSWAGWTGNVLSFVALSRTHEKESNDCQVWVESGGNAILALPPHESFLQEFVSQLPRDLRFIHVEAKTFTCSLRYYYPALEFQINENVPFYLVDPCLTTSKVAPVTILTGILLGDTSGSSLQVAALIVQELDGFYERITCTSFDINLRSRDTGGRFYLESQENMELFSRWMREETVRKTIRLG